MGIDTTGWVVPPAVEFAALRDTLEEMGLSKPLRDQFRDWGPCAESVAVMRELVATGRTGVQSLNGAAQQSL